MQVIEAVDSLHSEFRAVDNLVAYNTNRVLKAFHNVRLGSHVCSNFSLSFQ
jgi:cystathionine beta-lyase family protein involved in aluminum resistance